MFRCDMEALPHAASFSQTNRHVISLFQRVSANYRHFCLMHAARTTCVTLGHVPQPRRMQNSKRTGVQHKAVLGRGACEAFLTLFNCSICQVATITRHRLQNVP